MCLLTASQNTWTDQGLGRRANFPRESPLASEREVRLEKKLQRDLRLASCLYTLPPRESREDELEPQGEPRSPPYPLGPSPTPE